MRARGRGWAERAGTYDRQSGRGKRRWRKAARALRTNRRALETACFCDRRLAALAAEPVLEKRDVLRHDAALVEAIAGACMAGIAQAPADSAKVHG